MRHVLAASMWMVSAIAGVAAPSVTAAAKLPRAFDGWVRQGEVAAGAPSAELAPIFAEFKLKSESSAQYLQNGNTLRVDVYEFPDYTGAYGAFTFLREPNMLPQKIGDGAATGNDRVVFFRGNVLVDAAFDRVSAMTLSQLRDLSKSLPVAPDPGHPPTLPRYLPTDNLAQASVRYAIGPAGAKAAGVGADPAIINFNASPEIVSASYGTPSAAEQLVLISYPTPQIAGDVLRKLQTSVGADHIRRTHSILVIAMGNATAEDTKTLLNFVNYDADLTWNEATKLSPRDNVLGLLSNIIVLSGILGALMLFFGLFFGGFRVLYYKFHPEKAAAHEEAQQMIRLNL
ncbi:MAG: hypothetical protein NVS9B15_08990 [Acidobacteriaceae bacterium]